MMNTETTIKVTKQQPMLAATAETLKSIQLPCIAQFKLDGIRCFIGADHAPLSRKLKPIPNKHINAAIRQMALPPGLDGELMIVKNPASSENRYASYNETQSAIMSEDGAPAFEYVVFDCDMPANYETRWNAVLKICGGPVVPVVSKVCNTRQELAAFEEHAITSGMEGIITRQPAGHYKHGRSTMREQFLLKYKRFDDSEAVIVGFHALMRNANDLGTDERGYAKRSKSMDGLVQSDMLGSLVVKDDSLFPGVTFEIGTGFTNEEREEIWSNQQQYQGQAVTYKYQKHGVKDRPRIPSFKAVRM